VAEKLSALMVRTSKRPGKYPDGGNLYLQVAESTRVSGETAITKSWLFRYSRFGKDTWLGLGPYPDVSLKEARELALEERRKKRAGIDPLSDKRARLGVARAEHDNMMTFADCAIAYVDAHEPAWSNPKHVEQWRNTLKNIAGPVFGHMPVSEIETPHVLRCLEPIWTTKTETASRVRGRIESVLDWATVRKLRQGDNPARWKGHLNQLLPKPSMVAKIVHHAALPYDDIAAFMPEVRKHPGNSARALEFAILTAGRTSEILFAEWQEIDSESNIWIIPAEKMKAKREHRVPLSQEALGVLALVKDQKQRYIFPGPKNGSYMSNNSMLALLKRMKRTDITVHGFRSTFRDWAAETTHHPSDVAEMALAHTLRDKTEAAYRRGDLFEKRKLLMNDWGSYCIPPSQANVISLPKRKEQGE